MTAVSLFAGVGGFDLACERTSVKVVAAVEIDKAARSVLARRFPTTRLYEDVQRVHRRAGCDCEDCLPDGRIDIVCGGFPCQDLSVAGRRAGLAGLRSGLFYELARVIAETAPRWVVLENVPGLLSSNDGRDMAAVVGTLGDLGYGWAYRVLDAQFFGVPQRRRRVFVVGHLGDRAAPVQVLLEPESGDGDHPAGRTPGTRVAALTANGVGTCGADDNQAQAGHLIAATLRTREGHGCERGDGQDNLITHALTSEGADASEDGTGRGTPLVTYQKVVGSGERDAEGNLPPEVWAERDIAATLNCNDLGGESRAVELVAFAWQTGGNNDTSGAFKDDGTTPTLVKSQTLAVSEPARAVRRLTPMECERLQGFPDGWTEGQADAARYRQMGNAVAVPVVEWIMRRLVTVTAQEVAA